MVDHVYCINLERRPDRRQEAEAEFMKHGLDVEFWNATDGKRDAPEVSRLHGPSGVVQIATYAYGAMSLNKTMERCLCLKMT